RELGLEVAMQQLVDGLGPGKVPEAVPAQVQELVTLGEGVGDQAAGGAGNQDLASMGEAAQPRAAVHGCAVVIALPELGLAGVDADPHLQGVRLPTEGALDRSCRLERIR